MQPPKSPGPRGCRPYPTRRWSVCVRSSPPHLIEAVAPWQGEALEPCQAVGNDKPNHSDRDHARDGDIGAVEAPRFHDEGAESLHRADHFSTDDHHEPDTQCGTSPSEQAWQGSR